MAESTHWIVWVSIVGTAISVIGIIFLFVTIRQNSKTFEHIRRSSTEELKPYFDAIKFTEGYPGCHVVHGRGFTFTFKFILENTGKTPVYNVRSFKIIDSSYRYETDTIQEFSAISDQSNSITHTKNIRIIDPGSCAEIAFTAAFAQVGGWNEAPPEWYRSQGLESPYNRHSMPLEMHSNAEVGFDYKVTLQYVFDDISTTTSETIRVHEVTVEPSPAIHDEMRTPTIAISRDEVIGKKDFAIENARKNN
jgi:hypothetical protein